MSHFVHLHGSLLSTQAALAALKQVLEWEKDKVQISHMPLPVSRLSTLQESHPILLQPTPSTLELPSDYDPEAERAKRKSKRAGKSGKQTDVTADKDDVMELDASFPQIEEEGVSRRTRPKSYGKDSCKVKNFTKKRS